MSGASVRMDRTATRFLPEAAIIVFLVAFPYAIPFIGGSLDTAGRILDWGLFGLGFDLLFGFAGLLSFGQAAFFGAGGFVASYLLVAHINDNTIVALCAGTAVAAALGAVIGALSLRRAGIYFAMLTLAFGEMFYFLDIFPVGAVDRRRERIGRSADPAARFWRL
jgi:branched-chain amino acid transport system permease protein